MYEIYGGWAILDQSRVSSFQSRPTVEKDISLVVEKDRIIDIGKTTNIREKYKFSDSLGSKEWVISPGFIDGHLHSSQRPTIGKVKSAKLLEWLKAIWKWEGRMTKSDAKKCAETTYRELLASGVTSFLDYTSVRHTDEAFKVAEKIGLRATIGKTMMDRNSIPALLEDTDQSLRETEKLLRKWHGSAKGRLRYSITPRFGITCTDELLRGAIKLSKKYRAIITTHAHENRGEIAYDKKNYQGKSAIMHFDDIGLLGENTLLVHGVWLTTNELEALARTKTAYIHCPGSNIMLKSGSANVNKILKAGIRLGLGSDIGAYKRVGQFDQMQLAIRVQKQNHKFLRPQTSFFLATQGSADAMGLGKETGSLKIGKKADIVLLEPGRVGTRSLVDRIVNHCKPANVRKVIVDGKLLLDRE